MQADDENFFEAKLMQRYNHYDINAMMFYMYYLGKFNDELPFYKRKDGMYLFDLTSNSISFGRKFIGNCIFCGYCGESQAGKGIKNYIIQNSSLAAFYKKIKMRHPDYGHNYIIHMVNNVFIELKKNLHPGEEILWFDDKNKKIRCLSKLSVREKELGMLFPSSNEEISRLAGQSENLDQVCQALRKWLIKTRGDIKGNIKIFYTLHNNDIKSVPAISGVNFECCGKARRFKDGCVTKSFAKQLKSQTKEKNLYNELYEFVGLPMVK
jgi:hypothetical protein